MEATSPLEKPSNSKGVVFNRSMRHPPTPISKPTVEESIVSYLLTKDLFKLAKVKQFKQINKKTNKRVTIRSNLQSTKLASHKSLA